MERYCVRQRRARDLPLQFRFLNRPLLFGARIGWVKLIYILFYTRYISPDSWGHHIASQTFFRCGGFRILTCWLLLRCNI
jgi:hypothetical protein